MQQVYYASIFLKFHGHRAIKTRLFIQMSNTLCIKLEESARQSHLKVGNVFGF